jgi:glutamine synthetase
MASQIAAGLDGVATGADPGPLADTPYSADAPMLPKSLIAAIAALRDSACFRPPSVTRSSTTSSS